LGFEKERPKTKSYKTTRAPNHFGAQSIQASRLPASLLIPARDSHRFGGFRFDVGVELVVGVEFVFFVLVVDFGDGGGGFHLGFALAARQLL
jgi:hypothetical protein